MQHWCFDLSFLFGTHSYTHNLMLQPVIPVWSLYTDVFHCFGYLMDPSSHHWR